MGVCLEVSCICQDFVPHGKKRKICSSCRHEESAHFMSSSEEVDSSDGGVGGMGTRPYIERLQRSVTGSAVVEAIAETRSGFRPKNPVNKKVPFSLNLLPPQKPLTTTFPGLWVWWLASSVFQDAHFLKVAKLRSKG